jgi:hypothetical protein
MIHARTLSRAVTLWHIVLHASILVPSLSEIIEGIPTSLRGDVGASEVYGAPDKRTWRGGAVAKTIPNCGS